jgi:two-component system cell cycle sensor histidine kinase/response regulator CckA
MPQKEVYMASKIERGTILVVDDNIDIRVFAKRFLETAGYTVLTAADGEEGLRFYSEYRTSITLLLTDVAMPKLNGVELADRVLGMDSKLPILLMSGDAQSDYRGLQCVEKPFRPAELIETVNRVLNAKPGSARTASAA